MTLRRLCDEIEEMVLAQIEDISERARVRDELTVGPVDQQELEKREHQRTNREHLALLAQQFPGSVVMQ